MVLFVLASVVLLDLCSTCIVQVYKKQYLILFQDYFNVYPFSVKKRTKKFLEPNFKRIKKSNYWGFFIVTYKKLYIMEIKMK